MRLDEAVPGAWVEILFIPDEPVRLQAIRFGIGEGTRVLCVRRLPGGPVLLRRGLQEIAIGRALARRIAVKLSVPPGAG